MSDNGQEKQVLFEIKQLCKSFGPTKVLDHIDATIRQGEVVVIVGPSGSGKSTFLRSLNLLEMPTSGEILFEGKEITDPKSNLNQYRQKIGMVFQHFNLFANKTILENMTLAPIKVLKKSKAEAEKEAMELLARVGLAEKQTLIRHSCPAVRNSESPSFALCACIRMLCCLMSLPARLIRRWLARF